MTGFVMVDGSIQDADRQDDENEQDEVDENDDDNDLNLRLGVPNDLLCEVIMSTAN